MLFLTSSYIWQSLALSDTWYDSTLLNDHPFSVNDLIPPRIAVNISTSAVTVERHVAAEVNWFAYFCRQAFVFVPWQMSAGYWQLHGAQHRFSPNFWINIFVSAIDYYTVLLKYFLRTVECFKTFTFSLALQHKSGLGCLMVEVSRSLSLSLSHTHHTHTHTHHTYTPHTPSLSLSLSICNNYRLSIAIMVARIRLNVTLHEHCLSCFLLQFAISGTGNISSAPPLHLVSAHVQVSVSCFNSSYVHSCHCAFVFTSRILSN